MMYRQSLPLPIAALVATLLLILAGCAARPPVQQQGSGAMADLDADSRFHAAQHDAPRPTEADLRWWTRFGDDELARWVERALAANTDIALARERQAETRAALRAAEGRRMPQLVAAARVDASSRQSANQRRIEPALLLRLDWDADLWGELRADERAAAATLAARRFETQAARLSTAALTARAYLAWQQARLDLQARRDALALWRETARVVGIRVDAGLSPKLDGLRADGELAAAQAAVIDAAASVREAERPLQLLTATRPGAPIASASPPRLPIAPGASADGAAASAAALPVVLPLDLLRLRPDLQAAEQALRAAEAAVDAAAAAERPSLRLPGVLTLGTAGGSALLATVAAELAAPLFDGGQREAASDAARARLRAAELGYRQAVQQALAQTEAALHAHRTALDALTALHEAVRAADAAVQQARILYDNGLAGFLELLEAQRNAVTRRQSLRNQQADLVRSAVAAYEAMGLMPPDSPE
ncbi:efflux transporter outer membrane subunit [Piscinibacter sakaiensis]|uniref:efflux transporter outer membrane subunit n=1 Tax=Piscinibacter sakaiensis TaxID=1547922 RepID=UPI003AAA8329